MLNQERERVESLEAKLVAQTDRNDFEVRGFQDGWRLTSSPSASSASASSSSSSSTSSASLAHPRSSLPEDEFQVVANHGNSCLTFKQVEAFMLAPDGGEEYLGEEYLGDAAWKELHQLCPRGSCDGEKLAIVRREVERLLASAGLQDQDRLWAVLMYTCTGWRRCPFYDDNWSDVKVSCAINARLRTCNFGSLQSYLKLVHLALRSDARARAVPRCTVWRGTSIGRRAARSLERQFRKGEEVAFPNFTSTSRDIEVAQKYLKKRTVSDLAADVPGEKHTVLFRIHINNAQDNDVYQVDHLTAYPEEQEVLILPLVRMKVVELRHVDARSAVVGLEVVGPSALFQNARSSG